MAIESTLAPLAGERRVHQLAEGTELIGAYQGSGLQEPKYLVRRSDGQVMQLPHLLYRVAGSLDGIRDDVQLARSLSDELGQDLGPEQIEFLVEERLRPAGIIAADSLREGAAQPPTLVQPDLLLALRYRVGVLPADVVWRIAGIFGFFFRRPVYAVALAAFVALDVAIVLQGDLLDQVLAGITALIHHPELTLLILGLTLVSLIFHECGHVAACRYGGARPGDMGIGLYIVWPALYSTVTDAYRLDRVGRLRTDLGGVYFNVVFMVGVAALYLHTGEPWLLLALIALHTETAWQFLPSIRLDGYYILADLVGVPDLFGYLGPVLKSLLPGRAAHPRVGELRPWSRRIIVLWVVSVVPTLLFYLVAFLLIVSRALPLVWVQLLEFLRVIDAAARAGRVTDTALSVFQLFLLALPWVGSILMTAMLGGMLRRWAVARWGRGWFPAGAWTATRRRLRTAVLVGLGALLVLRVAQVAASHPATAEERRFVDGAVAVVRGVEGPPVGVGEWLGHTQLVGYAAVTGAFERHTTAVTGARELAVLASAVLVACLLALLALRRLRPLPIGLPLTAALVMGPAVTALATMGPSVLGAAEAAAGTLVLLCARRGAALVSGALLLALGVATEPGLVVLLAGCVTVMAFRGELRPGRPAWWPPRNAGGPAGQAGGADSFDGGKRATAGAGGRHRSPEPRRGMEDRGRWLGVALMLLPGALGVALMAGRGGMPLDEAEQTVLLLLAAVVVLAALVTRALRPPAAAAGSVLALALLPWSGAGSALVLALVAAVLLAALLTDFLTRGPVEQRPHPLLRAMVVVPAVVLVGVGGLFQPVASRPPPHGELAAWVARSASESETLAVPRGCGEISSGTAFPPTGWSLPARPPPRTPTGG